jgi:hypothetical protein
MSIRLITSVPAHARKTAAAESKKTVKPDSKEADGTVTRPLTATSGEAAAQQRKETAKYFESKFKLKIEEIEDSSPTSLSSSEDTPPRKIVDYKKVSPLINHVSALRNTNDITGSQGIRRSALEGHRLDVAVAEARADVAAGRYSTGSVSEHMRQM